VSKEKFSNSSVLEEIEEEEEKIDPSEPEIPKSD